MLHKFLRTIGANSQDPYFKQVSLLLHGDGTNGSQNNTFIDSSTNNFSITRNGNTTQGTNTPFSQDAGYWSNFFDGTGGGASNTDRLSIANNTALQMESSDFTIEGYFYLNNTPTVGCRIFEKADQFSNFEILLILNSASAGSFQYSTNGTSFTTVNISDSFTLFKWHHIAVTRNSSTLTVWFNGTSIATDTISGSIFAGTSTFKIGNNAANTRAFPGNISNFRVVKGTAVYTASFTPPTVPLTAITNTSLLTCQSNCFVDNSSNNFSITRNGDTSVQPFSPFAPTSAYSTSANGGSMYFDGTGDNLTFATSSTLYAGAGQFTYECWIYTTATAFQTIFLYGTTPSSTGMLRVFTQSGGLQIWNGTTQITAGNTSLIKYGAWNHIVVQRDSSNNLTSYVNGTRDYFSSASVPNYNAGNLQIGIAAGGAVAFTGYISNFRFISASALYSGSTITVPTAPLTAITDTQLLLSGTNAGIFDNTMKNDLETVGNAQVSTSVTKFGTGSMSFDGTGDWLTAIDTPNLQLSTGNFTIEGWVYLNAVGSARGFVSKGTSTTGWSLGTNSSNQVVFSDTATSFASTGTLAVSTWYHIAVVREGTGSNQTKIYINGTNDGTGTVATNFNQTSIMYVGADRVGSSALNGYIDDLRITKGIARYSANFTPPSGPYPNS